MKKIIVFSIITILLGVITLTGCTNNNYNNKSDGKVDLTNPTISAGNKSLSLPCTVKELLDFGFVYDESSNLPPFDINARSDDYSWSTDLVYNSDNTTYKVTAISSDTSKEISRGSYIVNEFSAFPKNNSANSEILINGISQKDSLTKASEKLSEYKSSSSDESQIQVRVSDSDFTLNPNGHTVESINFWAYERYDVLARGIKFIQ